MEHRLPGAAVIAGERCPDPPPAALARPRGGTAALGRAGGKRRKVCAPHVLVALPSAAGCARRFLRAQLRQWRLDDLADVAELLVSELVANALAATGAPEPARYGDLHKAALSMVAVRLQTDGSAVIVEVWDSDPTPPAVPGEPADWEAGWPLGVVASLSSRWGHRAEAGGKVIWCEIAPSPPVSRPDQSAHEARGARAMATGGR